MQESNTNFGIASGHYKLIFIFKNNIKYQKINTGKQFYSIGIHSWTSFPPFKLNQGALSNCTTTALSNRTTA